MANKIRLGFVGANVRSSWAGVSHFPALMASPDVEMTAVCTTRPESAAEAREAFGAKLAFTDYREMVASWIAEKRHFKNGVTPDFSTTGDYRDVAHYTQIIWRGSKTMGCAVASNRTDDYLVCRYSPPGNVVGQKAL